MGYEDTSITHAGITHQYKVLRQHDLNNCGPSSISMMLRQALNRNVAIGFIQMICGKMETGRGHNSGRSADERWHDWGRGGATIGWVLLDTMQQKWPQLNANENFPEYVPLKACTPSKPALCRIEWPDGSGHFIVCLGMSGTNFLFLDPYFGICITPDTKALTGNLRYNTAVNSFGKGTANAIVTYAIFSNPT